MGEKSLTFKELAKKILEEEKRPLTASEIWKIAVEKGYDKLCNSKGKTPERTLAAQLYTDTKRQDSIFLRIGQKPIKFFLKSLKENITHNNKSPVIPQEEEHLSQRISYRERDLHALLTYFVRETFNIYTKTIYHERSRRKSYTQWLHPDMVGVYFLIEDWEEEVANFAKEIGFTAVILFSYEIKRELNFNNLRESFFQAVSNSSWANEGYLVAAEIETDTEFLLELKRLSTSFGIGVIKLDTADPDASEILFPAKRKEELDWDTINKLASDNPDFKEFLRRVRIDLSTRELRIESYDKLLAKEELIKKFTNNVK